MLQSKANWKFTYDTNDDYSNVFSQLSISSLTERLLVKRGITTIEEAKSFLNPKSSQLHCPSLMNDMEKAVNRVKQAIENGESILVFGDYDADGVSSTTVMIEALRELGAVCEYYIPNRFTEGYGPNENAFKEASKQGFQLIITVDTGIAAVHEAEIAKDLGIDLIITDHHEVQEKVPDAFAIVHPKCSPSYPFKELAGVGVAFKFAHQLLGYFPKHLLDLVVIGTIADLVPLLDENRVLAYDGLKAISATNRFGIKALMKQCNMEGPVTEEDIGFLIGPRINAVGRLQDANVAVDLLLTKDPEEAKELAAFVQQLNQERQKVVSNITKEAEEIVEKEAEMNKNVIVVAKEGWNEGVLGIVASKLIQRYQRPTVVLSINPEKGYAKGSARSIDAFDLFSNCMTIRDTFVHFGGHAQAAGMTLHQADISVLRTQLNQLASEQLTDEDYKQVLTIDEMVTIDELSLSLIKEIEKLAPFGMGNPKPLFHVKSTPTEIRQLGSQQNHLKLSFEQQTTKLDCIGFGMGELFPIIGPHSEIDAVGELQINEWNGKQKLQLLLKDLSIKQWQLFDYRGSKHWQKQIEPSFLETSLAICFQSEVNQSFPLDLNPVQYDNYFIDQGDYSYITDLFIMDLPASFEQLENVLSSINPKRIYACYRLQNDDQYFHSFPTREDFKWFYGLLLKRKYFDLEKDTPKLAKHKGWKVEKIQLMIKIFYELDFVKMETGKIIPFSKPSKRDLTESTLYQRKWMQSKIEAKLYYSTYKELKEWFDNHLHVESSLKEEVSYGL
ncbi:single-stranded-DNA-specific exonuclease RecJ [Aquibacillus albus]|uniref:Single-stranded-DNA-specific exonuclease RecJ n=1 Tax=Aquibacillus albus TaxID=1168171 RepID=A0ABS2MUN9_9BACI|nr:single-stranded-DNA-specific exonuclease RecJ [Aquibacillus albus]MBM7569551.1 single-stranded-DNA-specific exonuclease [Aquibacillus albus]